MLNLSISDYSSINILILNVYLDIKETFVIFIKIFRRIRAAKNITLRFKNSFRYRVSRYDKKKLSTNIILQKHKQKRIDSHHCTLRDAI